MADPTTVVVYTRAASGARHGELVLGLLRRLRREGRRAVVVPTLATREPVGAAPGPATFDLPVGLGHADATVVISASASPTLLRQVTDVGIPLVLADRESDRPDVAVVRPDDAGATHLVVEHLVSHGHTRIGFVGATRHPEARRRYAAYHAAVVRSGLLPEPEDEFLVDEPGAAGGRRAARHIAERTERPTAVVVASDAAAIGLLEGLAEAGVAVPGDLAVVSFGADGLGAFSEPPLTSVDLRPRKVGEQVAHLVRLVLEEDPPPTGVSVAKDLRLVTRRSCGCGDPRRIPGPRNPEDPDAARYWYRHAGAYLRRALTADEILDDQNSVDAAIFGDPDVSRLGWLAGTRVHGAALALWRDRAAESLTIVGWHGNTPDLVSAGAKALGSPVTAWAFPPEDLLDSTDDRRSLACLVVPVATTHREWGLLAVVGDLHEEHGVELVRHWSTLLAIALDRQELTDAVHRSEARYAAASRAGNDGVWEYRDRDGSVYASERTRELLGALPGTVVTSSWWLGRIHPDDREPLLALIQETLRTPAAPVAMEYRIGSPSEGYRWMLSRAVGVAGPDGTVERVVGAVTDIDRRRSLEERLRYSALHDALTGLANRAHLNDRLADALAGLSAGTVSTVGLLFFDLDDFKEVNDRFGHLAGDDLLREVAGRLGAAVRDGDTPARFGGDEFAVLVLDATAEELHKVAERVRDAVAVPLAVEGTAVTVTASIGVAGPPHRFDDARDLLRYADAAMYRAKAAGRGQIAT